MGTVECQEARQRVEVGHGAVVCSRSIRSPGHVSSALYAVQEVRNYGPGRRKHKTPDNITHPFPDHPFEKLFCRWVALFLPVFLFPPYLTVPRRREVFSLCKKDARRERLLRERSREAPSSVSPLSLSQPSETLIISAVPAHAADATDKSPMRLRLIRRLGSRCSVPRFRWRNSGPAFLRPIVML